MSAVTLGIEKSPAALVIAGEVLVLRVSLTRTAVAPGIAAPWASLTMPKTLPVVIWAAARAGPARQSAIAARDPRPFLSFIDRLLYKN